MSECPVRVHVMLGHLNMRQPLLKVVIVSADRPPKPVKGVLDVPLNDLSAFGSFSATHLHQFIGGIAVLG